jgi:uncharacterized protein (TIGR04141 family)
VRVNIFRIPAAEVEACKAKLVASQMQVIKQVDQAGWHGEFFYSTNPSYIPVGWAKTYAEYFEGVKAPSNLNHWAAFVLTKGDRCYVLGYGKAHFYLRPFCDYDFGIEVAKRIANEADTRQTASRRFQGTKKKDIKTFANNTLLDVESGESVDYIQAGVTVAERPTFGKSGKFGSSALLTPDIEPAGIGSFLNKLDAELAKPARFPLPRTTIITEPEEIARFDELLLDELTSNIGATEFTHNSFDLYGVDFVFSNDGAFAISCPGKPKLELEHLSVGDLKTYISDNHLERKDILRIKVRHDPEDAIGFNRELKETLDFIADDEQVLLTGGKWMHFNQDYLDFLDEFLRSIEVEETEPEFLQIFDDEPAFNISADVKSAGYDVADKNFSILKTKSSTPIEAWDLRKGSRVYAVKFGTAQKLNYVCDQSTAVLELLRNKAGVRKVPNFQSYCLWLGYRGKKQLHGIADTGSIILKQKIEIWARKAREVGVEPVIKISRKMKQGVDE